MMRKTNHPDLWWAIHNLIAHPISEIAFWLKSEHLIRWTNEFHDWTIPEHESGSGRG